MLYSLLHRLATAWPHPATETDGGADGGVPAHQDVEVLSLGTAEEAGGLLQAPAAWVRARPRAERSRHRVTWGPRAILTPRTEHLLCNPGIVLSALAVGTCSVLTHHRITCIT